MGDNEVMRMAAAKAWSLWEAKCCTLEVNKTVIKRFTKPQIMLSRAQIMSHYFSNNCFLEPNQILQNINTIKHIPSIIIHSRFDIICPFENAWLLHQAWPNSQLEIISKAGHSYVESGVTDALVRATQAMMQKL